MTGIAARLSRNIAWDSRNERIVNDAQAAAFYACQPQAGFYVV